jgi:hypothetical protein
VTPWNSDQSRFSTCSQFRQCHFDRPLAAQHGVAGAQERASVVSAVPHILRGRDHPRQAFNALTFLGLQLLAPAVESGRRDDPLHQGRRIGRVAVDVARNSAERGLGQPGLHLLLELFDRGNPSTKTQNLGDLARLHHGCIEESTQFAATVGYTRFSASSATRLRD